MRESGVLPDLSLVTLTQQPLREEHSYALLPDAGVSSAPDDDVSIAAGVLVRLQAALEHGSMIALQRACEAALPELKAALRMPASLSSGLHHAAHPPSDARSAALARLKQSSPMNPLMAPEAFARDGR